MLTHDRTIRRETLKQREAFLRVRNAEYGYARQLRKIARHVGEIVKQFDPHDPGDMFDLENTLHHYSNVLAPWARTAARRVVAEVGRRDELAWAGLARTMSRALAQEVREAPTGQLLRDFLNSQVELITSLPTQAAQRVHELTLEGQLNATRMPQIAERIMETGRVTQARANLIARTEIGRTATGLAMARAKHVGSEAYIWRTVEDRDVRPSHRKMNGKVVFWNEPPTLDGLVGHAGSLPACRCYVDPIIPDTVE